MSMYKQMKQTFITEYKERPDILKSRIIKWNAESPVTRVDGPTNIARARELGYRAKQGVVVVRVRVSGGSSKRKTASGGRKPSKSGRFFTRAKSLQAIAEERAAKRYANCEILNSYFVGKAGPIKFYEVILLDRNSPVVQSDAHYSQVITQRNRVYRGLTTAGRRHRGLLNKGFGSNQTRPSRRAVSRR